MTRQDLLSVSITFLVGFLIGGYLYLTGFAPALRSEAVPSAEEAATFRVVGEAYGGCAMAGADACPAFQLLNDGSYRYRYVPAAGAEPVIREGELPRELERRLRSALTGKALTSQSEPIEPATCSSYVDGIDVRYVVTLDGTEYTLDSCGTDVVGESPLWSSLSEVWDYFERR